MQDVKSANVKHISVIICIFTAKKLLTTHMISSHSFSSIHEQSKKIVVGSGWLCSQNRIQSHESAQKSLFGYIRTVF
jgi:hypothetical protein